MLDYLELRDEIERVAEHLCATMGSKVRTAIADAQWDLQYGSGGGCTYGFAEALDIIRPWIADHVEDIRVTLVDSAECEACGGSGLDADPDMDADADADPCPDCDGAGWIEIEREERIDGTRERILEEILGRELARHV